MKPLEVDPIEKNPPVTEWPLHMSHPLLFRVGFTSYILFKIKTLLAFLVSNLGINNQQPLRSNFTINNQISMLLKFSYAKLDH